MVAETVKIRMNQELKQEVQNILGDLGLTMSGVVVTLFKQIKLRKGLPFVIKMPKKNHACNKNLEFNEMLKNMQIND